MIAVRVAQEKDAEEILALLQQVLELHAKIRPDMFVSGTTKYSYDEVIGIINDKSRRSYVAVDENERVLGHALCIVKEPTVQPFLVPFRSLYIDDFCVDESAREKHIGTALFDYVKEEALRLSCYEITLNVWEGNDGAIAFYERLGMKPKSSNLELVLKSSN